MLSPQDIIGLKKKNQKFSVLTAYDYNSAKIIEECGIEMILVGDSLANVMLGYERTEEVSMEEMLVFTRGVVRGARNTHIIADMPHNSYLNPEMALENARKFLNEGANSVKLEGLMPNVIEHLVKNNIPVIGHLGLLPQTAISRKQVGKTEEEAQLLKDSAKQIEDLGVFAFVLEHIPGALGKEISETSNIPTIGIGAGPHCNSQVMVFHDVMGIPGGKYPPFSRQFANLHEEISKACKAYHEWALSQGIE